MAENTNELGFIPNTTIKSRYIAKSRFILQYNERGYPVGYLLHGALNYGQPVVISQACIQYEKRLRGYGEMTFRELLNRAEWANVSSIHLAVAADLPAVQFWQSLGFQVREIVPGGASRKRMIVKMFYPLNLPLLTL